MHHTEDHEFNPFTQESLDAVETVEALPHDPAFDHVMFDNMIERVARYEYAHRPDQIDDEDPIFITSELMTTQLPETLRRYLPDTGYLIKDLHLQQLETNDPIDTRLELAFSANNCRHQAVVEYGTVHYTVVSENSIETHTDLHPDSITGLIASLVYARQYDPADSTKNSINLAQATIHSPRDENVTFIERMIMTLGHHSGRSVLFTKAYFETGDKTPLIATTVEQEYPDKNSTSSNLTLSEWVDAEETAVVNETELVQREVTITESIGVVATGRHAIQYAEQRSTNAIMPSLSVTEKIDPDANYARWAKTCQSFLRAIEEPMSKFRD